MFLEFAATGLGGLLILVICEALIKSKSIKGEYARKLVHIAIAVYASTWAFFLPYQLIILISLILVTAVILVQRYPIMQSMKSVRRVTNGEVYFAVGIGVAAAVFREPAMYAVAVLHMGLADGFAAIVGVGMSKKANRFKVKGSWKSIEGTLTFVVISFFLNDAYWMYFSNHQFNIQHAATIPIYSLVSACILAVTEVVSPKGSDNVIIPLASGTLLWLPFALASTSYLFV